jgi:hypothetical protein
MTPTLSKGVVAGYRGAVVSSWCGLRQERHAQIGVWRNLNVESTIGDFRQVNSTRNTSFSIVKRKRQETARCPLRVSCGWWFWVSSVSYVWGNAQRTYNRDTNSNCKPTISTSEDLPSSSEGRRGSRDATSQSALVEFLHYRIRNSLLCPVLWVLRHRHRLGVIL